MKKISLAIVLVSIITFVNSSQATLISAFDINGTYNASNIGILQQFSFGIGIDEPAPLGTFGLNKLELIQSGFRSSIMKDMLQRTFASTLKDPFIYECLSNYNNNQMVGLILLKGDSGNGSLRYFINPIPDLSDYIINDLYIDNFITQDGSTVDYDIRILADVTPIPEPSTFILLAVGVAGIALLRKGKARYVTHAVKQSA